MIIPTCISFNRRFLESIIICLLLLLLLLLQLLHIFIVIIWDKEEMIGEWKNPLLFQFINKEIKLHKQGDKLDFNNNTGISIVYNHLYSLIWKTFKTVFLWTSCGKLWKNIKLMVTLWNQFKTYIRWVDHWRPCSFEGQLYIIVIVMWWQISSTHTKIYQTQGHTHAAASRYFVSAVPKWVNKNYLQWPSILQKLYQTPG